MTKTARTRVADLLLQVADGAVSGSDAIVLVNGWHDVPWKEPACAAAFHALHHVASDADIRSRDAEYAHAQNAWLRRCAENVVNSA
jgi:hypothetical protein